MIVTYVFADSPTEFNTSNWRCVMPHVSINKTGKHKSNIIFISEFIQNSEKSQSFCNESDIIVVERNLFGDTNTMIQFWKGRNKIVIANFDDAYNYMTQSNISYPFWKYGEISVTSGSVSQRANLVPPPLKQFEWGLKLCAGAIMPSKVLVEDWKNIVPTYLVPNYPSTSYYKDIEKSKHDGIIIGWGGSLSHFQSFTDSGVLNALKRICKKNLDVKLMIAGDKRVYDIIDLPEDRKIYQPYVPFEEWSKVVANFDIGLAPLSGEYDRRRSWIKPLEYMLLKIPWLASDIGAYDDIREYGNLVKNRYDIWEVKIKEVIDSLGNTEKLNVAYDFAMKQDIDANVHKIIKTFQNIIDKGYN